MAVKREAVRVSVRLYKSDVRVIDEIADQETLNRSDILRKIIREYVEGKKNE